MKKHNWKRTLFYIRRGLIRWAVMIGGTLSALCMLVYMLEDPNGRLVFYLACGLLVALLIGNRFYGEEDKRGQGR